MNKNIKVDTAKNGQTTTKNTQPEKVVKALEKIAAIKEQKKTKVPTGKVINLKETEERRKAREQEYRNFRVAALRRRCKRMKKTEEETEELVKKLLQQLDEPNMYQILLMFNPKNKKMIDEILTNNKIEHHHILGDYYVWIDGDDEVLKKLREILPEKTKIHPYVKRKPPILEKKEPDKKKKPTSNTAAVKKKAKADRKALKKKVFASRKKHAGKAAARANKQKKLSELKAQRKAKVLQMVNKAPSKVLKTASKTKKAALI